MAACGKCREMRPQRAALVLLLLGAGCAETASPPLSGASHRPPSSPLANEKPESDGPEQPRIEPACLPQSAARGGVAHIQLRGPHALACFLGENESARPGKTYPCLLVDVVSKSVLAREAWTQPRAANAEAPSSAAFELTLTASAVTVCARASNQCSTVKVLHKPMAAGRGDAEDETLIAAVNDDGSRLFVFAPELKRGQLAVYGDVYAVPTGKRLAHVELTALGNLPLFADRSNSWSARFLGRKLVLGDYVCCGPGGVAFLFDPDRKHIRSLHGYDGELLPLGENVYAVRDENTVTLLDVEQMRELAFFATASESAGSPEEPDALIAAAGSTLVVAYANPPGLLVIDITTRSAAPPLRLPICL
jgi:hypothetical protein